MLQTAQSPQIAPAMVMTPRPVSAETNQALVEFALRVRRLLTVAKR